MVWCIVRDRRFFVGWSQLNRLIYILHYIKCCRIVGMKWKWYFAFLHGSCWSSSAWTLVQPGMVTWPTGTSGVWRLAAWPGRSCRFCRPDGQMSSQVIFEQKLEGHVHALFAGLAGNRMEGISCNQPCCGTSLNDLGMPAYLFHLTWLNDQRYRMIDGKPAWRDASRRCCWYVVVILVIYVCKLKRT